MSLLKTLLIEDSEEDAELILMALRKGGFDPVASRVFSAASLCEVITNNNWDVIICDHNLPGFNSFAALSIVKSTSNDFLFLVVSGAIGEEAAVEAIRAGAHDYVSKNNLTRLAPTISRGLKDVKNKRERIELEERLRSVIEHAPVILWSVNRQGDFTFFNGKNMDRNHSNSENLIGRSYFKVWEKSPQAIDNLKRTLQGESFSSQVNYNEHWYETQYSPIKDSHGVIQGVAGVSTDITRSKKAEEASRFLAMAGVILGSSLEYSLILQNIITLVVPKLADCCILTLVEPSGELSTQVVPIDDQSLELQKFGTSTEVLEVIRSLLSKIYSYPPESQGPARATSLIIVPIVIRNEALGAITLLFSNPNRIYNSSDLEIAEDLGRRAGLALENAKLFTEAETRRVSAQNALRTRDEFLSIASHELRTPITSLKLQLQLAKRNVYKGEKYLQIFDIALKQVNRLTHLIDDLLDVAKINSGKLTFQFEEFNFSQMINEVVTRFQDQFKLVECLVEVISDDSVVIFGDTFRLEQVIINLITNSLKYGAGKPILISVFQDDHFAYLKIRDFGIGIPKEKQHLIFNRFERVVSDQNISGLGLGLYIAHQIVETHKGKIEVESDTNKGATFTVRIPISLA